MTSPSTPPGRTIPVMNENPTTISGDGSTAMPLAVDFRDISKIYDGNLALDAASLGVPLGQTLALLGPNSASKSTTISLMLGLLDPSAGVIRVPSLTIETRRGESGPFEARFALYKA